MPATRVVPVRAAAVLGLAMAAGIGWIPTTAQAATGIPADQTGQQLGGAPITAIVGDIDGDGVRELVSLGPRDDDPVHLAVRVFEEGRGAQVVPVGSAPLTRMASVTEQLSGLPRPDENNLLQARIDEPARLVAWHENGREHVLAMAIGTLRNARACCLTIWEVQRGGPDGIRLRMMADTMRSADQIRVLDMDADGTDELVVTEPRQDADPNSLQVAVLRWTGSQFEGLPVRLGIPGGVQLIPMGDSDGLPGEEVGLPLATESGTFVHRIALDQRGRPRIDQATLPFAGSLLPMPGRNGGRVLLGSEQQGTVLLSWPAGRKDAIVGQSAWVGVPVATIGSGPFATVVKIRDARLLDLFGTRLGVVRTGLAGTDAEARFRHAGVESYVGPVPGGTAGGAAFIFRGRLVATAPSRRGGGPTVTDTSVMPGGAPIGLFGRQLALLAVAQPSTPSLQSGFDATREGGQLSQPAGRLRSSAIVVADAAVALAPEADEGLLQPDPQGPVQVEDGTDAPLVLAGGSFILPVSAPPGTQLQLQVGDAVSHTVVGDEGQAELRVGTEDYDDGDEVHATLLAITPAGQGYGGAWDISVHTRPPALNASTPFAPLSFDVGLSGRASPESSVTVDGSPVRVSGGGHFDVTVSAGLWPRDVTIEATDPLGNRTTRTVSVVALLDYRQLPWIPIVALLTIVSGFVLYLRVPHARPEGTSGPITDATLEDLD